MWSSSALENISFQYQKQKNKRLENYIYEAEEVIYSIIIWIFLYSLLERSNLFDWMKDLFTINNKNTQEGSEKHRKK